MIVACSTAAFGDRPPAEVFEKLARIGYQAVELSAAPGHPCHPDACDPSAADEIGALARGQGLAITALHTPITWAGRGGTTSDALDAINRAALTASRLGAPLLCTTTGAYPPQCDRFEAWDAVRSGILHAADHAESLGIELCVEPHVGHMCMTWESTIKLIREVGSANLRVCFDAGHFLVLGLNHSAALERLAPRIAHVHLRDFVLRRPPLCELREPRGNATQVAIGDGDLSLVEHLEHLESVGYSGALSIMLPETDVDEALVRASANLASALA
ncbi:MAG TPA: sugar phosphate isomerase/epimerase family protein [Armatimonadota bacterium]|nr:sugar phosphate isomerase/epimerase family protein [Armatimonadota bacterium]